MSGVRAPRHVYELSPIGALLGDVIANPCDPGVFRAAAQAVLTDAADEVESWYDATAPDDVPGRIRYVIWSEVVETPCCKARLSLYDAMVRLEPAVMVSMFSCPECGIDVTLADCERIHETATDALTGEQVQRRLRVPVRGLRAKWIQDVVARANSR